MADPTLPAFKTCGTCKSRKAISEFSLDRSRSDGREGVCKPCRKAARAAIRAANLEDARSRDRERMRALHAQDPDRLRGYARARYAANPEAHRERLRQWRADNPDRVVEINEKASRRWREANRDTVNERTRRRRALQFAATIGPVDLDALWQQQGGICSLCSVEIEPNLRAPEPMSKSIDHIVPLSKGGTHEQSNLQWTHLVCNIRKGAKTP